MVYGRGLWKCQCELQLLQICRTVKKCGRLYSWAPCPYAPPTLLHIPCSKRIYEQIPLLSYLLPHRSAYRYHPDEKKSTSYAHQIAKILNTYGSMDMKQPLEYTEYRYKQIENSLLRIWDLYSIGY